MEQRKPRASKDPSSTTPTTATATEVAADAALARLVGDIAVFSERHWGRQPLLRHTRDDFSDLFDLACVEALLDSGARRPTVRLVRDGSPLSVAAYTRTIRLGGVAIDGVVDPVRLAAEVAAGATVILQGLQRTWPPLARFARSLELATSHPVQINAYLGPKTSVGLARHADGHDVIVVQVDGSKTWDVDGLGEHRLTAGDVLYLPAGTPHAPRAEGQASLHLTIGLLRVTQRDVLRRAVDALGSHLDRPLPLGYARTDAIGELHRTVADLLARAGTELGVMDVNLVAQRETLRSTDRLAPTIAGQLRSVLALGAVDASTIVRRRADRVVRISANTDGTDERVDLDMRDRTLHVPAFCRRAIEMVLDGDAHRVDELPDLDPPGRVVLVRRLIREHILIVEVATVSARAGGGSVVRRW